MVSLCCWLQKHVWKYNCYAAISMRIYPHLQDTGGFFVAVLQRKSSSTKSPR